MTWRDLLQNPEETIVLPWVGGRSLRGYDRVWAIDGRTPNEIGWYRFSLNGRKAKVVDTSLSDIDRLGWRVYGYLVGDRIIPDGIQMNSDPLKIVSSSERVYLIEDGLDRFVRVSAGCVYEGGPLIYYGQEMPLGVEEDVLSAFLDQKTSVDVIPGVPPALDAAFRMETWQRVEAEKRRLEEAVRRQAEEEQRQREENRRKLVEQLGDGAGRRAMARVDFNQAARAALAIGGAELLDIRRATRRGEMVVRFRLNTRRFECTCDEQTLRIIDAGICLTAHYDDTDFEAGIKGDTWLTLESLPGVIMEADREGKLVVFRHVN